MNLSKIVLFIGLSAVLLISCKKEENLQEKEEREIKEQLDNIKVDFYRTIKVTVRSTTAESKDPKFAEARKSMLGLVTSVFRYHIAENGNVVSDSSGMDVMDAIKTVKTFYGVKDVLLKTDEDSLPTILGNIISLLGNFTKTDDLAAIPYFMGYDNNYEHAILGTLWAVSPSAPKEFSLYEFQRAEEDKIGDTDIRVVVKLAKALIYLDNQFYWHSREKSDQYLQLIEDNKEYFIKHPLVNLFEESKHPSAEAQYYQLHSLGYLMRALAEQNMDMQNEADDDMELFVEEAEKGGGDNELVWTVGAYIQVKKENKEKAIVYLNKLEKSNKLGEPEKKAAAEIKTYMENRESEKALTPFKDKLAILTITYNLIGSRLEEAKKMQQFKNSKEGGKLYELQQSINDQSEMINSLGNAANTDSLSTKAKSFVKNLFGK